MSEDSKKSLFNVSSYGQTGGITAGQVNVSFQGPQRRLEVPTDAELGVLRNRPVAQVLLMGFTADEDTRSVTVQLQGLLLHLGWDVFGVITSVCRPTNEVTIWTRGDGRDADPMVALAKWLQRSGLRVVVLANQSGDQIEIGPAA
ncbi:MAG: hypothetical protein IPM35_34535 [Myxococcales bacterium]|nr:hypothetical protein [Myxococcales bacterium]